MIHTFSTYPSQLDAVTLEPLVHGQVWVTDEVLCVDSPLTRSEVEAALLENNKEIIALEEEKSSSKNSAMTKLKSLGLTEQEIAVLLNSIMQ